MNPHLGIAALLVTGSIVSPVALPAQDGRDRRGDRPSQAFSFVAGPSSYRLIGTGTSWTAGLRFDLPLGRMFIVEPGIGFFRYRSQFGQSIKYLFPEVGIQIQPARGQVRPYLGVGAGFSEYLTGPGASPGTVHAAAGVRAWLTRSYGLRAEVRLRGLDPFSGQQTTDFTIGVGKR